MWNHDYTKFKEFDSRFENKLFWGKSILREKNFEEKVT